MSLLLARRRDLLRLPPAAARLRLEADTISGLVDGAAVANWPDQSGNGHDAVQTVATAQPTYQANAVNGLPAVRFTGTTWLDSPALTTRPLTVVMLLKTDNAAATQHILDGASGTDGLIFRQADGGKLVIGTAGSLIAFAHAALGSSNNSGTANGSPWSVAAFTYDPDGGFRFVVDGVEAHVGVSQLALTPRAIRLGATTAGANGFAGSMAFAAVYDTIKTPAELAAIDASLRAKYALPASPSGVLRVPTGLAAVQTESVTHPDILHFPAGWNGHPYWMAITPFPPDADENPSIFVSSDGDTWTVPAGLTNPVAPRSEAQATGADYNSDTELLMVGSTMELYYRYGGGTNEAVVRRTSTDGVTWTAAVILFQSATAAAMLSPAVVLEADNSRTMWTVNNGLGKVQRRTSTDGTTWTAPADCTLPTGLGTLWHLDVARFDGLYHMLLATKAPYRLRYLTSTDGITWNGDATDAVALTGTSWDAGGHYRSTFLPLGGNLWDVWVSQMSTDTGNTGDWHLRRAQVTLTPPPAPEPAPTPTVLVSDDFSEADGTVIAVSGATGKATDTGQSWVSQLGDWVVTTQQARCSNAAAGNATVVVDAAAADVTVEANCVATGTGFGIVVRSTDANNFYVAAPSSNGFFKRVAGTYTSLGSLTNAGGLWKVECSGTTIKVYLDGVLELTVTDSTYTTQTKHGLWSSAASANPQFDNFAVHAV